MFEQQAEEQILPPFIRARCEAGCLSGRVQPCRIALGRQNIQPIAPAVKSFRHGDAFKSQAEIGGHRAMRHDTRRDGADIILSLSHQTLKTEARTIPFQQGEFRRMTGRGFAIPPNPRQFKDRPRARHQ